MTIGELADSSDELLVAQKLVLDQILRGDNLSHILTQLVAIVEAHCEGAIGSILLLDKGRLRLGAAPGLPDDYNLAIEGIRAGEGVGSCGTAAHRRERVVVADIQCDPLWADFRATASEAGLRACWSTPILGTDGNVLATFALYYKTVREPTSAEQELVDVLAGTAGLAIERSRAEAYQRESRRLLIDVLDRAPVAILLLDSNLRFIYVNPAASPTFTSIGKLEGRTYEEIMRIVWPEKTADELVTIFRHTLETGEPYSISEFTDERIDLKQREYFDWRIDRITLPNGEFGVVCYFTDVSAPVFARKALAESEAQLRFMAESMPQMIFTTTSTGTANYHNRQWEEYTGMPLADIMREGARQFIHPDDHDANIAAWEESIRAGTAFEYEHRLRRYDGEYRWHVSRAHPLRDDNGDILMWIGSSTDVHDIKRTESLLRESRERLVASMEASGTGTFRWDIRTNELEWDEALDRLFGLPPGQTVRSLNAFVEIVHPDDRAGVIAQCNECARVGSDFNMEFRVVWPDGTIHWLLDKGKTFKDEDDAPLYMTGACIDITERMIAKAEVEAARDQAMQASEAKSAFLANMSHELRTPLNAIIGYAEMLQEPEAEPDEEERRKDLQRIEYAGRHLLALINDILDLSKIEAGKMEVQLAEFDVRHFVDGVAATVQAIAAQNGNNVLVTVAPMINTMHSDEMKVRQILLNLLSNACKFTQCGEIRLRVYPFEQHGECFINFEVIDTGPGLSPLEVNSLFQEFSQLDSGRKARQAGSGLGLAITRRLCILLGGDVTVKSAKGKGSSFTATLPLHR